LELVIEAVAGAPPVAALRLLHLVDPHEFFLFLFTLSLQLSLLAVTQPEHVTLLPLAVHIVEAHVRLPHWVRLNLILGGYLARREDVRS